jgi:hypothetical protein
LPAALPFSFVTVASTHIHMHSLGFPYRIECHFIFTPRKTYLIDEIDGEAHSSSTGRSNLGSFARTWLLKIPRLLTLLPYGGIAMFLPPLASQPAAKGPRLISKLPL